MGLGPHPPPPTPAPSAQRLPWLPGVLCGMQSPHGGGPRGTVCPLNQAHGILPSPGSPRSPRPHPWLPPFCPRPAPLRFPGLPAAIVLPLPSPCPHSGHSLPRTLAHTPPAPRVFPHSCLSPSCPSPFPFFLEARGPVFAPFLQSIDGIRESFPPHSASPHLPQALPDDPSLPSSELVSPPPSTPAPHFWKLTPGVTPAGSLQGGPGFWAELPFVLSLCHGF